MFTKYRFFTQQVLRYLRDNDKGRNYKTTTDDQLIHEYAERSLDKDKMKLVCEHIFMRDCRAMSITATPEIVDFVQRCGYDIDPATIHAPADSMIIHFPMNLELEGHRVGGSVMMVKYSKGDSQWFMDSISGKKTSRLPLQEPGILRDDGCIVDGWMWRIHAKTPDSIGSGPLSLVTMTIPNSMLIVDACGMRKLGGEVGNNISEDMDRHFLALRRLICRLLIYTSVFPESLKPGVPEKHLVGTCGNTMKSGSVTIGVVDQIRDVISDSSYRIPHFRCGHFRTLRSERFIHKRGQTIFVKATFVGLDKEQVHIEQISEHANPIVLQ